MLKSQSFVSQILSSQARSCIFGAAIAAAVGASGCGVATNGLFDDGAPDAAATGPFGADGSVIDSGARPFNPPDSAPDAGSVVDATAPPARDAGVDASADATIDAKPEAGPTSGCDADGDGHRSVACGGDDCCDIDPDVYPRSTPGWFDGVNRCGQYDYDCDGIVYLRFSSVVCSFAGGVCSGEGYVTIPVCGTSGRWEACTLASGACAPDPTSAHPAIQECH